MVIVGVNVGIVKEMRNICKSSSTQSLGNFTSSNCEIERMEFYTGIGREIGGWGA